MSRQTRQQSAQRANSARKPRPSRALRRVAVAAGLAKPVRGSRPPDPPTRRGDPALPAPRASPHRRCSSGWCGTGTPGPAGGGGRRGGRRHPRRVGQAWLRKTSWTAHSCRRGPKVGRRARKPSWLARRTWHSSTTMRSRACRAWSRFTKSWNPIVRAASGVTKTREAARFACPAFHTWLRRPRAWQRVWRSSRSETIGTMTTVVPSGTQKAESRNERLLSSPGRKDV